MPPRSAHTILVVDDNPAHRYATVRALSKAGFKVTEAWNASQAFEGADSADAVVLDVFLPDLDGREVCRRLRSQPETAAIPIIHITSIYLTDHDREEAERAGSDAYLISPVAADVLVDTIDTLIARRRPDGPGPH